MAPITTACILLGLTAYRFLCCCQSLGQSSGSFIVRDIMRMRNSNGNCASPRDALMLVCDFRRVFTHSNYEVHRIKAFLVEAKSRKTTSEKTEQGAPEDCCRKKTTGHTGEVDPSSDQTTQ